MQNVIQRNEYLDKMTGKKGNGLIKVITGIRRCGKSFLLFNLFYDHLLESGVKEEQIIMIALLFSAISSTVTKHGSFKRGTMLPFPQEM